MMKEPTALTSDPRKQAAITWLTLFASGGTLICCTIPITLVSLGLGGAMVALTTNMPFLVTLTHYKVWIFVFSAALILFSGWLLYRPGRACPADPGLAAVCNRLQVWNRRVYWFSIAVWAVGLFFAFLLLPIRVAMGW